MASAGIATPLSWVSLCTFAEQRRFSFELCAATMLAHVFDRGVGSMSISSHLKRPGILAAALIALVAVIVGGAQPASSSPGQVTRVDVTGAVFTCTDGSSYTVTSGDAMFLLHESTDQTGGLHITGTVAPRQVTLSHSGDSNVYHLAGASWFGGNLTDAQSDFTDTEFFQILGTSGGVVDTVSIVAHFTVTANGDVTVDFVKDSGTCHAPED
jgi:hypothetical protein